MKEKKETGEENPREPVCYICHTSTASHMLIHRPLSLCLSVSLSFSLSLFISIHWMRFAD